MAGLLIYGYGNPGRRDDGLGIAAAEEIGAWAKDRFPGKANVDTNYQLNIEDAEKISHYQTVIFTDASREDIESFSFTTVAPSNASTGFTMHAMSPAFLLYLCRDMFHKEPGCFLLHIKGCEWELKEGLSENAGINLQGSLQFLKRKIETVFLNVQKE